MKRLIVITIICLTFAVVGSVQANNAYRYHMLYKNSETYKKLHEDKSDSIEDGTKTQPRLDGWGNLVDEPPPPETGGNGKQNPSGN